MRVSLRKITERVKKVEKDIRILLVDDHQVVRDGLRNMLGQENDMEVVGQSAGSEDALAQIATLSPNIVLMDIKMPRMDGIQLAHLVKQKYPNCNVVMLTLYDEYLTQAIEAGARGYLLKDISREELTQAIRQVHQGELVISKSIATKPQIENEGRDSEKTESGLLPQPDSPDTMLEEIQFVIPPPVEANQLLRFTSLVEEILQPRVLQVIGSWREGTAVTAILSKAIPLVDILGKLRETPEIESVREEPLKWETSPSLIKKASAIPRQKMRPRKTIFVNLKND